MVPSARENLYGGLNAWPFLNTAKRQTWTENDTNYEKNPISITTPAVTVYLFIYLLKMITFDHESNC